MNQQTCDLILENARIHGRTGRQSILIGSGHILDIIPDTSAYNAPRYNCGGMLATAGFVESHIHLDKAMILDRCPICAGTLSEAVSLTASAKAGFTEEDVYARAATVLEDALRHGTLHMRSFVEIDPRAGLRSFNALRKLKTDYSDIIDLELCAFAQEGLTNERETISLLETALANGAALVGGCPYTDPDPIAHVSLIFDLAQNYGVNVDFHADFDLNPEHSILPEIIKQTIRRGMSGRVTVGHATKLAAMSTETMESFGRQMAGAGVGLAVLPATDLYLNGRGSEGLRPRGLAPALRLAQLGVSVALATNNVLNPFTPFGDCSLLRMAGLYANIDQLASDNDLEEVFKMISSTPAAQLGLTYGLCKGAVADIALLTATSAVSAVRTGSPVAGVWKSGKTILWQPRAELLRYPSSIAEQAP